MLGNMRPYKDFAQKRRGKRVDYDGAYWFQCADLAKLYIDEGLEFGKMGALLCKLGKDKRNEKPDAGWHYHKE